MISGFVLVAFGLVSAFSGFYLILKGETPSGQKLVNYQVGVAGVFVCSHLFITIVGVLFWFRQFSIVVIAIGGFAVIVSRYLNGRLILHAVHWQHYVIVMLIIAVASLFYPL